MKKLSILLIGLLLLGGFASADVMMEPAVALTGSATVTWGLDLNTNATGFMNTATGDLVITFVAEATDEHSGGMDDLYGKIIITDYELTLSPAGAGGSTGTITAAIVMAPATIWIYAAPTMSWGNVASKDATAANIAPALTSGIGAVIGGITLELDLDPATVKIYVVSDGDWVTAPVNTNNDYGTGADVTVVVDIVTIKLGGYYGWFNAAATAGATAQAKLALDDVLNGVTVTLGADLGDLTGTLVWEIGLGTVLNLTEANADDDKGNVAVDLFIDNNNDLDIQLSVTEPTAGGFVDMVGATVTAQIFDVLATLVWNIDVTGEYSSGGLRPYFGFGYGSDTVFNLNLGVALGADFTGIDLTTITIDYISTQLSPAPADNGILTVAAKIAY
jgi:hypothetical protein